MGLRCANDRARDRGFLRDPSESYLGAWNSSNLRHFTNLFGTMAVGVSGGIIENFADLSR